MVRLTGSKLLAKILLLFCFITLISLLALSNCGYNSSISENSLNHDDDDYKTLTMTILSQKQAAHQPNIRSVNTKLDNNECIELLHQREDEYKQEVTKLTEEIKSLKLKLLEMKSVNHDSYNQKIVSTMSKDPNRTTTQPNMASIGSYDCTRFIRKQVGAAEILHGLPLNNEYELIPFNHFTFSRVYPIELGLGKRVVEKPIGFKRKDLLDALSKAIDSLNKNHSGLIQSNSKYILDDFSEGIYRNEPTTGTQYELYFRNKDNANKSLSNNEHGNNIGSTKVLKVIVMRPFAPLQTIQVDVLPKIYDKELIHIILPLSGRTATFQSFMDKFVKIALKHDKRVQLTVIYFGEDGLSEARSIMSRVLAMKKSGGNSSNLKLLALNETFSRAKGLRVGAEKIWNKSDKKDVLLFMCDVDVVFSAKFLDRCRWNTKPGKKVYYPVVFSLYNPHVVYTLQGKEVPPETDQLMISRDTGFWRDFGYGMTCQYRSDFLKVRGFDEEIVGWGGEDVMLYRKYVRSNIKIIRATDPGIFHIWHPKVCTGVTNGQQLTADQYRACIRSRALNEASHAQLGFLAFRDDIAAHNQNNSNSFLFVNNSQQAKGMNRYPQDVGRHDKNMIKQSRSVNNNLKKNT